MVSSTGCGGVEAVAEIEIDIVELHIFQCLVKLFDDMLSGKSPVVCAAAYGEEYFGRDDKFVAAVFF